MECTATVTRKEDLAPDVRLLELQLDKPLVFTPGLFVMVNIDPTDKKLTRAFSIASTPNNKQTLELCVKIISQGAVSPKLCTVGKGETLGVKGPYGNFTLQDKTRPLVFIAGGTGIAPLRSMLQQVAAEKKTQEIWLFYRFQNETAYLFKDELEALEKTLPTFKLIPSVSNPPASWQGETRRIHEIITKYIKNPEAVDVYICGSPVMVEETMKKLEQLGFDPSRTFKEKW